MILELTGHIRHRKEVSSHVQMLKNKCRDMVKTSVRSMRPQVGTIDLQHISDLDVVDAGDFQKYDM